VIDLQSLPEPLDDVEAMVRAAGHYVQASQDLRPRVLERARTLHGERRARLWVRHLALVVILLMGLPASVDDRVELTAARRPFPAIAADPNLVRAQAGVSKDNGGNLSWGLVETFTELRRQQSQVLRLEL
jgi:hypothetical protein